MRRRGVGQPEVAEARHVETLESRRLMAAGDLDASFAAGGVLLNGLDPNASEEVYDLAVLPDGGTVFAGRLDRRFLLFKHTPAGLPDASFGTSGRVTSTFEPGYAQSVAVQPDGRILVAGTDLSDPTAGPTLCVQRYTAAGQLDPTWGDGGTVTRNFPGASDSVLRSIALQPDGKLLVGGSDLLHGFTIARLLADGSPDLTFGGAGTGVAYPGLPGQGAISEIRDIKLESDGYIVLAGAVASTNGGFYMEGGLAKLTPAGLRSPYFSDDGYVPVLGLDVRAVAVGKPFGPIVVAGWNSVGFSSGSHTARVFTGDGRNPTGSAASGATISHFVANGSHATDVLIHENGSILLAGTSKHLNSTTGLYRMTTVAFRPNLTLDTSFGTGGVVTTDTGAGSEYGNALAWHPDGRFVVAGAHEPAADAPQALAARHTSPGTNTIAGTVYEDANANAQRETGEGPVTSARRLYLDANQNGAFDNGEHATLTNASGAYQFTGLNTGTYLVRLDAAAGHVQTAPPSGGGISVQVAKFGSNLPAPEAVANVNFGSVAQPSGGGIVHTGAFLDKNADGVRDVSAFPPVPDNSGWTVFADLDRDGTLDANEPSAVSEFFGLAAVRNVPAGTHEFRIAPRAGYEFTVPAAGVKLITVTAGQTTGDSGFGYRPATTPPPAVPVTLRAAADAYVRDGSYAGANHGAAAELQLKRSGTAGSTREAYLRFDLSGVASVANAKLRLNGRIDSATQTAQVAVYGIADDGWDEGAITWNTRPPVPAGAVPLATQTIATSAQKFYEWDLTQYLATEKAAGRNAVTLVVRSLTATDPYLIFASDEAAASRPELVVTPNDGTPPPPPPQQIVVSATQLSVPEGANRTFGVTLAAQPSGNVVVTVSKGAGAVGDPDLSAAATSLTFTPANWNVAQHVAVAAAQDADAANGSAGFALSSTGLTTKVVTATEVDDDVVATLPIAPLADAYVRDGSTYAGQNFGTAGQLVVKRSGTSGNTREAYLRFAINDFAGATAAKLRVFARSTSSTQAVGVNLFGAGNPTWSETGLTWNNKPAAVTASLGSRSIGGTAGAWHEFDVTEYVRQQQAAGASAVTFVLKGNASTDAQALIESGEAATASSRPLLVVSPGSPPPPPPPGQEMLITTTWVRVPEGGTTSTSVRLAVRPASDVTVTIAPDAESDPSLTTSTPTLVFTPANWSTPQTVTVHAAEDPDASGGGAEFWVRSAGLQARIITATEIENDQPPAGTTLRATADAYARDGSYAATNFGTAAQLQVKKAATGWNRETFLRFDLSGVSSVSSATLRLFGKLDNTTTPSVAFGVYASGDTAWGETTVNWNTRPQAGASPLASGSVTGTTGKWYELDLTGFLQQQKAAGARAVTLVLRASVAGDAAIVFDSDEAANAPSLVVNGA